MGRGSTEEGTELPLVVAPPSVRRWNISFDSLGLEGIGPGALLPFFSTDPLTRNTNYARVKLLQLPESPERYLVDQDIALSLNDLIAYDACPLEHPFNGIRDNPTQVLPCWHLEMAHLLIAQPLPDWGEAVEHRPRTIPGIQMHSAEDSPWVKSEDELYQQMHLRLGPDRSWTILRVPSGSTGVRLHSAGMVDDAGCCSCTPASTLIRCFHQLNPVGWDALHATPAVATRVLAALRTGEVKLTFVKDPAGIYQELLMRYPYDKLPLLVRLLPIPGGVRVFYDYDISWELALVRCSFDLDFPLAPDSDADLRFPERALITYLAPALAGLGSPRKPRFP